MESNDVSFLQQNLQQKLALSRKSINSIEAKMQIIRNLSEKIITLQKKSKNEKIDLYELFADKNQIEEDFQNYQKTKMIFVQEKNNPPLHQKYQYLNFSKEEQNIKSQNSKFHQEFNLASTKAHSEISQTRKNKSFADSYVQTVAIQQHYFNKETQNQQEKMRQIQFCKFDYQISTQRLQIDKSQNIKNNAQEDIEFTLGQEKTHRYEYTGTQIQIFLPQTHLPLNCQFSFISQDGDERIDSREKNQNYPLKTQRYFQQNSQLIQNFQASFIGNRNRSELNISNQSMKQRSSLQAEVEQKIYIKDEAYRQQQILKEFNILPKQQQFKSLKCLVFCSRVVSYQYEKMYLCIQKNGKLVTNSHMAILQQKISNLEEAKQKLEENLKQQQLQYVEIQNQAKSLKANNLQLLSKYQQNSEELALNLQSLEVLSINFSKKQNEYLSQIKTLQSQNQVLANTIATFTIKMKQEGVNLNYAEVQMLQEIINNRQKSYAQEIAKLRKEGQEKLNGLSQNLQKQRQNRKHLEKSSLQIVQMYDDELALRDQEVIQLKRQLSRFGKKKRDQEQKLEEWQRRNQPDEEWQKKSIFQNQTQSFLELKELKSEYKQIDFLVLQHKYARICCQLQNQLQQKQKFRAIFADQLRKMQEQMQKQKESDEVSNKDLQTIRELTLELQTQHKKNERLEKMLGQKKSVSAPSESANHAQFRSKLQKLRKYAKILEQQIQAIYKVDQCQQHCQLIKKLSNLAGEQEFFSELNQKKIS